MRLNLADKYESFKDTEGYLSEESIKAIEKAVEGEFGDMWNIRIGDFFACVRGDFSHINLYDVEEMTIAQKYWVEKFNKFVTEFSDIMQKLQLKQTPEQAQAASVCISMSLEESILIFMREYFGLHSFQAVEEMRLCDFLIAKKDAYNTAAFNKALAKIESAKYTKK